MKKENTQCLRRMKFVNSLKYLPVFKKTFRFFES